MTRPGCSGRIQQANKKGGEHASGYPFSRSQSPLRSPNVRHGIPAPRSLVSARWTFRLPSSSWTGRSAPGFTKSSETLLTCLLQFLLTNLTGYVCVQVCSASKLWGPHVAKAIAKRSTFGVATSRAHRRNYTQVATDGICIATSGDGRVGEGSERHLAIECLLFVRFNCAISDGLRLALPFLHFNLYDCPR